MGWGRVCYGLGIVYLRCYTCKKNGKRHRYWSVVESRRLAGGKTAQRQVLYLGEINDSHGTIGDTSINSPLAVFLRLRSRFLSASRAA